MQWGQRAGFDWKKNTKVETQQGNGKVIDTHILTQLVVVEYENGEKDAVPLEEIKITSSSEPIRKKQEKAPKDNKQSNPSAKSGTNRCLCYDTGS